MISRPRFFDKLRETCISAKVSTEGEKEWLSLSNRDALVRYGVPSAFLRAQRLNRRDSFMAIINFVRDYQRVAKIGRAHV